MKKFTARQREEYLSRPLLTIEEAADFLNVSTDTLRRLVANGHLARVRVGARRVCIARAEIDRYVAHTRSAALLPKHRTSRAESHAESEPILHVSIHKTGAERQSHYVVQPLRIPAHSCPVVRICASILVRGELTHRKPSEHVEKTNQSIVLPSSIGTYS